MSLADHHGGKTRIYILYLIFIYIYISFFPNPNQDRTIGRESLASLLQQPSSNQGLHNSWTVISLALLTIDILRSKFLATKRQFWRCLLKMIWCTPVARVATALALSMQTLKSKKLPMTTGIIEGKETWRNLKKPAETWRNLKKPQETSRNPMPCRTSKWGLWDVAFWASALHPPARVSTAGWWAFPN